MGEAKRKNFSGAQKMLLDGYDSHLPALAFWQLELVVAHRVDLDQISFGRIAKNR